MHRRITKHFLFLAITAGIFALTFEARACPVCFAAEENSRIAYYITTALLLLLPFIMVSAFVLWYRRRARLIEQSSECHMSDS